MKTANELKEIVINQKAMLEEQVRHTAVEYVENEIAPKLEIAAKDMQTKLSVQVLAELYPLREIMANYLRGNGYQVNATCGCETLTIMWN